MLNFDFQTLANDFEGEFYYNDSATHQAHLRIYATDASVYQEMPTAVALPKTISDCQKLIHFADKHGLTLIPRTAGTSLAGQVVGSGIVVDVSKYFTNILEINAEERWVRVQPGVIRDDLNAALRPYGLMFGPETSTANRAMIGGMIGNNSCGLHSIVWGTTRDHLLEAKVLLADGSEAVFGGIRNEELGIGNNIFQKEIEEQIFNIISNADNQRLIEENFPKKSIARRNTGYALDALHPTPQPPPHTGRGSDLLDEETPLPVWGGAGGGVSTGLTPLIAGSEGTLCLITEAKLNLLPLPPKELGLLCVHCHSLNESMFVNVEVMKHGPLASELVDKYIMDFTVNHPEYRHNRFFIDGDPAAVLMVEFGAETREEVQAKVNQVVTALKNRNLGYAFPLLFGDDSKKAWDMRKAGLGLLNNINGDWQVVNLIEDCAVTVEDLPDYIADVEALLKRHELEASYCAHAGAGEIHITPLMNLKTQKGRQQFREVLAETAVLVKKYNGSLSGEHGDGRLRGEFIPFMMGNEVYELFREVKRIFDPKGVFNKGKITDTPPMDAFFRFEADVEKPTFDTVFDFTKQESILRLAEKCSGSGDCRKTHITGGTLCPSYMATRSERDSTRARANMLRHFYSSENVENQLDKQTKEVLDLCLSCKACKTECPSGVDVSKMKAEFMQQYHDKHGIPFRTRLIANFSKQMQLASYVPWAYNFVFKTPFLRKLVNRVVGFHAERSMPLLDPTPQPPPHTGRGRVTIPKAFGKGKDVALSTPPSLMGRGWGWGQTGSKRLFLFLDEFTKYNDGPIGQKAIELLQRLGYEVIIPKHVESGRTYLSKGLVKEAKKIAIRNVELLADIVTDDAPLVGIEPSAILSFRDEYLSLVPPHLQAKAEKLAKNTLLFDEFIAQEIDKKNITHNSFTQNPQLIKLHGHCHQKAIASQVPTKKMLSLPQNYSVQLIPSGCCGMAGSFGYEAEHYDVSMAIGELVLFPTVRQQPADVAIAAAGTSCRHQIKDGTGRTAKHPIEILWEALELRL